MFDSHLVQYYCCKREESEKGEEEEPELATMSPSRPLALSAPPTCYRSHAFCPSCARCSLPFYLQHPERLCNGGRRISYRTVQQQDMELPMDLASFYQKLNLIRQVTMKEVVTHSVSTDV
uniref:Protein FAM163B-like n=1 Tax=Pundamilia nyererei TaxID=303518 RepID=A0A3B4FKD4_9CICH